MKFGSLLVVALGVFACDQASDDSEILALARQQVAMPECESADVEWAYQKVFDNRTILNARIKTDRLCMKAWEENLLGSALKPQDPHGEWVEIGRYGDSLPPQTPFENFATSTIGGSSRGISMSIPKPLPSVEVLGNTTFHD